MAREKHGRPTAPKVWGDYMGLRPRLSRRDEGNSEKATPCQSRPVTRTACGRGRAGFTGGSPAVNHTNMLGRIVRVVWERRRLKFVEEQ